MKKSSDDKVPHDKLLSKLKEVSARKYEKLINREMKMTVRDARSKWRAVTSGVPQVLVLVPVIIIIH